VFSMAPCHCLCVLRWLRSTSCCWTLIPRPSQLTDVDDGSVLPAHHCRCSAFCSCADFSSMHHRLWFGLSTIDGPIEETRNRLQSTICWSVHAWIRPSALLCDNQTVHARIDTDLPPRARRRRHPAIRAAVQSKATEFWVQFRDGLWPNSL
jgi:hypothetical protein